MASSGRSIKRKLSALLMVSSSVVLLFAGGAFMMFSVVTHRQLKVRELSVLAEMIGEDCAPALIFRVHRDAQQILMAVEVIPSVVLACVYDAEGRVFALYQRTENSRLKIPESRHYNYEYAGGFLRVFRLIRHENEVIGSIMLQDDMTDLKLTLGTTIAVLLGVMTLALWVAYVVAGRLQGLISQPLEALIRTAVAVTERKDYSMRTPGADRRDEIGVLARAFNEMMKSIHARENDLRKANEDFRREIVEHTKSEEALRESRRMLLLIMNSIPQHIFWKDRSSVFLGCNENFAKVAGVGGAENIVGKTDYDLAWRKEESDFFVACDRRVMEDDRPEFHIVEPQLQAGGKQAWLDTNKAPLHDEEGRVIGVLGTYEDITERIKTEKELERYRTHLEELVAERTADLKRSNADLENFAYVASHDLQEPLRKIQAFGDRLTSHGLPKLDETERDYLTRMINAAHRMQLLIEDLLTYSRIARRGDPFVSVDLTEIAKEVVSDLEDLIRRSGGQVEIGSLPRIDADPIQMRQLLQNLIQNGLKFRRTDVAPRVRIRSADRDGRCILEVEDNGIGFDERYVERIFTIFQRLHSRAEYAGTGIGLAVCRKIVERHGGTITATSRPGEGSTFIVSLPLRQVENGGEVA